MNDRPPPGQDDPFSILSAFSPPSVARRFLDEPDWRRWAGTGTMHGADKIRRLDREFPDARRSGFLLVGNCGNGDWIALDLANGTVGYEPHEWLGDSFAWRPTFLSVSRSLEAFFEDADDPVLAPVFPVVWFDGVDKLRGILPDLRVPDRYEGIDLTGLPPLADLLRRSGPQ